MLTSTTTAPQLLLVCPGTTTKLRWPRSSHSTFSDCTQVRNRTSHPVFSSTAGDRLCSRTRAVPSSSQFLVLSPFTPKYTIHNSYLNVSTTVTTKGFDPDSVRKTIPAGAAAYVKSFTVNGVEQKNRCHFDFYDVFRVGGEVVIEVTADKESVDDCGAELPESISTGGFAAAR